MLLVNSCGHSAYQNFVVTNLRKYYPNPDSISRSTWDISDRFWNFDLSFTDDFMKPKYSVFAPMPKSPSCMQRSYLLSIDFKVTSSTDWAAQLLPELEHTIFQLEDQPYGSLFQLYGN